MCKNPYMKLEHLSPGNVAQEKGRREGTHVDMNLTPALQKGTSYLSFHPSGPHPRNSFFVLFPVSIETEKLKKDE